MPKRKALEVEEEEERYFLNPGSVSHHLYCSICQDVFNDPQRAPCGHSFCRKCITPWLKSNKTCPEDRKPVHLQQIHHDFILENIIGDQMVACPFRRAGCEFVGQLQLLKSHKRACDFNPVNLPSFLKEEDSTLKQTTVSADLEEDSAFIDPDKVPSPVKPSLKMRLFRAGETKKRLLSSMFDKENSAS
ncbi:PZR3B-like protein [Mya arenaria]|uniref:PZR3B-like protein n=1 Tax=Mya arenaria TaxID=6604 RepID=A0ABY7DKR7_MYAAR|nr:RING finger protein 151-like [Mya arenaria]WAQ96940.1 PZR3B-like protein [Mya arenaria]